MYLYLIGKVLDVLDAIQALPVLEFVLVLASLKSTCTWLKYFRKYLTPTLLDCTVHVSVFLVCRLIGLSIFWYVDVLVCRRFSLSTFWCVDISACRHFGCRRFGLSTFKRIHFNTSKPGYRYGHYFAETIFKWISWIFYNLALHEFYFLNMIYILVYIDLILSTFFQHANILTRASHQISYLLRSWCHGQRWHHVICSMSSGDHFKIW